MSSIITLAEAQTRLKELIEQLIPGEELLIEDGGFIIAHLTSERKRSDKPRIPGTMKGTVLRMDPDFNAPLEDFKEYL